jgi:diguanylate cyclase (GGDEF)-like protein
MLTGAGVPETVSVAYVPLLAGGDSVGVLAVLLRDRITAAHAEVLGLVGLLAAEAGLAINRDHLRRRLEEQARSDDLTGLANRRAWRERLAVEIARAERNRGPLCLAVIDLDHFKAYNDTHGHHAGDVALRDTARAWEVQTREVDLLARLGGEEFVLLLPDTPLEEAEQITQRLLDNLTHGLTASAGLAQWHGEEPDSFYRRADEALYAAKAGGRNHCRVAADDD